MGTAGNTGDGLRRLRLLAGMSLRDLADAAGVSHMVIQRAERTGHASEPVMQALAGVLGPRVYRVLGLTEPPETRAGTNAIVQARRALGLSRRQCAAMIGVSDKTLARAEAGLPIRPDKRQLIASALGLDIATVLDLTRPVPNGQAA
jgi:transcriptional regulator with XRE-family HTH domain